MINLASAVGFAKLLFELASGIKILMEIYKKVTTSQTKKNKNLTLTLIFIFNKSVRMRNRLITCFRYL